MHKDRGYSQTTWLRRINSESQGTSSGNNMFQQCQMQSDFSPICWWPVPCPMRLTKLWYVPQNLLLHPWHCKPPIATFLPCTPWQHVITLVPHLGTPMLGYLQSPSTPSSHWPGKPHSGLFLLSNGLWFYTSPPCSWWTCCTSNISTTHTVPDDPCCNLQ